jgi:hypothetical protein
MTERARADTGASKDGAASADDGPDTATMHIRSVGIANGRQCLLYTFAQDPTLDGT